MIPFGPTSKNECGIHNDGKFHIAEVNGEYIELEEVSDQFPLYGIKDKITLSTNTFPNIDRDLITNIGQVLINEYFFVYAAGDRVKFVQGKINNKVISKIHTALITDSTVDEVTRKETYLRYFEGANFATIFEEISVVAASLRAMTASKAVLELRAKLLEEYKDQLENPQVLATIDEALSAADREYLKGDVAEAWFTSGKMIDVVRKKLFGLQGGIERLGGDGIDFVSNSLVDGYRPEDLPAIINQLRSGSYDRGASTGLGGYAAEMMGRINQSVQLIDQDCGVSIGKREIVNDYIDLSGRYEVGSHEPITEESQKAMIGKRIILRDPTACKAPDGNVCRVCMGDKEASSTIGIQPRTMAMANVFLKISLSMFHGTASKTNVIDPLSELR
jgi:hypothetical protein